MSEKAIAIIPFTSLRQWVDEGGYKLDGNITYLVGSPYRYDVVEKFQVRKGRIAVFFHNIITVGRADQICYVPIKFIPAFIDPLSERRKRNYGNSFLTHQISLTSIFSSAFPFSTCDIPQ